MSEIERGRRCVVSVAGTSGSQNAREMYANPQELDEDQGGEFVSEDEENGAPKSTGSSERCG